MFKFITDIREHADSNLADIYFGEMRYPTRWERFREQVSVAFEHLRYAYHASVTCRLRGCDMECEEHGDAESGPSGSGYCHRCMRVVSW